MVVKVPNQFHPLIVSLDERQSPLAARFFQQQLSRNAWSAATLDTANDDSVVLGPADPHPLKLAKMRPPKFAQRGLVAFTADSDTKIVINLSGKPVPAGPIIGRLTTNSLNTLIEAITTGKRKAHTVQEAATKPAQRRRKIVISPYEPFEPPSDQLKRLKNFEKRFASWQVSHSETS